VGDIQNESKVYKLSGHIETRRKLRDIPEVSRFDDLLERSTLTDEDKEILRLHYLKGKDFRYIGDTLGYAEATIKTRHRKALAKLNRLF
jgi:RNA polymerase sigma factor (sigma-70 family)